MSQTKGRSTCIVLAGVMLLLCLAWCSAAFAYPAESTLSPRIDRAEVLRDEILASTGLESPERTYIVVFKDAVKRPGVLAHDKAEETDGTLKFVYRSVLKGYAARMPESQVEQLEEDPRVRRVEMSHRVKVSSQTVPTGLERIGGLGNLSLDIDGEDDIRVDADIAVIDTGIDPDHPDLNVVERVDCVPSAFNPFGCTEGEGSDGYGHGTHVAGTVGALDNSFGVAGVAPGARLWSVRVLNNEGWGQTAWIIAGIDWVTAHADEIDVANMSLGCRCQQPAEDEAIEASAEAGVVYAVAAANSSADVKEFTPAGNPDALTVSALADYDGKAGGEGAPSGKCTNGAADDTLATFSNFGKEVDIAAPGVCILSTVPVDGSAISPPGVEYASFNGTSMAAPHVAGAAAILASEDHPEDLADIESIEEAIVEAGSEAWTDTSGDGVKEPLLDIGDEGAFKATPVVAITGDFTHESGTTVTLHGQVAPQGLETSYYFEYGTTTAYGSLAPAEPESVGSSEATAPVSQTIEGLAERQLYHYRLVATNSAGTFYGKDRTFGLNLPSVWSESASEIDPNAVTLEAEVNPEGLPTTFKLEYGKTSSYGRLAKVEEKSLGSGTESVAASGIAGNLADQTTYHYRVVAMNPAGIAYGEDATFTTAKAPWQVSDTPLTPEATDEEGHEASAGFSSVSCASRSSCMALGVAAGISWEPGKEPTFAEEERLFANHWDGDSWTEEDLPSGYSEEYLSDLDCPTVQMCVVVGNAQPPGITVNGFVRPIIDIWGGSSWERASGAMSLVKDGELTHWPNSVSCASAKDCTAVGFRRESQNILRPWAIHLSHGKWSQVTPPHPVAGAETSQLWSVSCLDNGECLATGRYLDEITNTWMPLVETYDGSNWEVADAPDFSVGPLPGDLSCSGPDLARATCAALPEEDGTERVWWLQNGEWREEALPTLPGQQRTIWYAVDCSTPTRCRAAGIGFGGQVTRGVIASWNGSKWSSEATADPSPAEEPSEFFDVSCPSSWCAAAGVVLVPGPPYGGARTLAEIRDVGPIAETWAASDVGSEGATLNARVNPRGQATSYRFEYGSTVAYGTSVPLPDEAVGSGTSPVEVSQAIEGLEFGATYHYRVVAESEAGTSEGEDRTFTVSFAPKATTESAAEIKATSATLNGTVNPGGGSTDYYFEFGEDTKYGFKTDVDLAGSGTSDISVDQVSNGLNPGTTYHYRFVAENSNGVTYGEDKEFKTLKVPKAITEAATEVTAASAKLNGTVNPEGSSTGYFFEWGEGKAFDHKTKEVSAGSGTSNVAASEAISGLKAGAEYRFRIVAKGATTVTGEDKVFTTTYDTRFDSAFGKPGTGNGELKGPRGIATDSSGNVWVADTENNRIQKFNSEGKYLFAFGKEGTGTKAEFKSPAGIAIDSSGNLWIADTGNDRVLWYSATGEYKGVIGKEGTEVKFKSPTGIAVTGSGPTIYVVDSGNNRVVKLSSSWKVAGIINESGKEGSGDGELKAPQGIHIDAKNRIWVADTGNNRIQRFNSSLAFVSKFGTEGSGDGQLKSPTAIAADFQERLWVADSGNNRAQKFDLDGNYLDQLGEKGAGKGQLEAPHAVALPAAQKVLLLDSGNARVQSWSVKAEPPTATTSPATNIGIVSATLKGTINPEGLATTYWFEYGTSEAYGSKTAEKSLSPGLSNVVVEEPISGLEANKKYYFQVIAKNSAATVTGANKTFTTLKAPKATTEAATEVKATTAKLNGTANPEGSATNYYFEYGKTTSYGSKTSVKSAGSGTSNVAVTEALGSLEAGTTYHFRVVADKGGYTVNGADKELTTLKAPKATTEAATEVKATSAKLNGTVNPEGSATGYYFEYGESTSYGSKTSEVSAGSGTSNVAASEALSGLKVGTTYHFRVVAEGTGAGVTVNGADKEFTTESAGGAGPPAAEFAFAFGEAGSEDGQFEFPTDVALDSSGNAWVIDTEHSRIEKFNSEGEYVSKFGSQGSSPSQLDHPEAIAIDASGNLWIADTGHNKVKKFNSNGEYLSQFGSHGTGNGQFSDPRAIAVDASGNIWVADAGNDRVQKFNSNGEYLSQFGSSGSGNGQFGYLFGIAIDASGHIWVTDASESGEGIERVQKFNSNGEYLSQFGSNGTGDGQFKGPWGIAVDSGGNLWVSDSTDRVQKFSPEGEYLGQFGEAGSGDGQFDEPLGIAIDASGGIWVADSGNNRVQKWVMLSAAEFAFAFGEAGSEDGQFEFPTDVALDSSGNAWVIDTEHSRIEKFNSEGEYVSKFGSQGSSPSQLDHPEAIAIDASGNLWIADTGHNKVKKFNSNGEYLSQFGSHGTGNGQFSDPRAIAVDASGNIWVADAGNDRVQKFNSNGEYLSQFGSSGSGNGQFGYLFGIAIDASGHIWVTDASESGEGIERVQKFNSNGEYLSQFGSNGTGDGQFKGPWGIAVDSGGNLWVSDSTDRVQKFSPEGEYLGQFGEAGSGDGQFDEPLGIAIDASGGIWVADSGNNRVQKWVSD